MRAQTDQDPVSRLRWARDLRAQAPPQPLQGLWKCVSCHLPRNAFTYIPCTLERASVRWGLCKVRWHTHRHAHERVRVCVCARTHTHTCTHTHIPDTIINMQWAREFASTDSKGTGVRSVRVLASAHTAAGGYRHTECVRERQCVREGGGRSNRARGGG